MKRKLPLIIIPILILYAITAIYIVPVFLKPEAVETKLGQAIKAATGRDVIFSGPLSRRLFPWPRYSSSGIRVKNIEGFPSEFMLETGEVALKPSILSLLTFRPDIAKITINNPVFLVDILPGGKANFGVLLSQNSGSASSWFPKLELLDGKFILKKGDEQTEVTLLNSEISYSSDSTRPVKVTGAFGSGLKVLDLTGTFGKYDTANNRLPLAGEFSAGESKISFDGALANASSNPVFAGKISLNVNRLPRMVTSYLNINSLTGQWLDQNFNLSGEGEVSAEALKIPKAETLFAGGKGTGSMAILFQSNNGQGPLLGIAMKISTIDLDALGATALAEGRTLSEMDKAPPKLPDAPAPVPEDKKAQKNGNSSPVEAGLLPDDLEIIFNISSDEVNYRQQKLNDVKLEASLTKNRQAINNLSFGLPGNSKVEFSAVPSVGPDGQGEQINGHVKFYGDNLVLVIDYLSKLGVVMPKINLDNFFAESDFVYSGKKIYFPDLDILLSDASFSGKLLLDGDTKKLEAIIQAVNLDLDKLLPAIEIEKSLKVGIDQNITIFDNLRTLPYKVRIAFSADELVYGADKYSKAAGEIGVNAGILSSSFEAAGGASAGNLKAALKVDASSLKPTFEGSISADHLDLNDFIALRKKLEDVVYLGREKPAVIQPKFDSDPNDAKVWPVEVLNFSGLNFVEGIFKVNCKSFTIGKMELKDLSSVMKMRDGVLSLDPFKATLFGGPLDLKANIATRGRPGASATYALSNADLGMALGMITKIQAISGHFGISGSASFSGFNINDWMNEVSGSGNILARNIEARGFNLKDLYERLTSMKTPNAYETFMTNVFSSGTTKFDFLGGNFFMNDGILTTKNVILKSPYIYQGSYNVKMNMGTLNLQSELDISPLVAQDKSIPVTFYVRGNLDDLHGDWDYSAFKPYWEAKSLEKTQK